MSTMTEETPEIDETTQRSPLRWVKRAVIAAVVLVALAYGAIFFYATVLNDAPDALDTQDLAAALADDDATLSRAPAPAAEPSSAPEPAPDAAAPPVSEPAPDPAEAAADTGYDGVWAPTTASQFGYRVDEVLGGVNVTAVGRSNEIDGTLVVDGTTAVVDVTVQIDNIVSDDARRDGQFRGRIMDSANFPTAAFRTTSPIEIGALPADGEPVTVTAAGELTLKGATVAVDVAVTAQADGDSIGVLGNIPVTFGDYGIDNPSIGAVTTEDHGLVEFVLVFERG